MERFDKGEERERGEKIQQIQIDKKNFCCLDDAEIKCWGLVMGRRGLF